MADYIYMLETRLTPEQQRAVKLATEIARAHEMNIYLTGVVNCFNSLKLRQLIDSVPEQITTVNLRFEEVSLIDHSTLLYLLVTRNDWKRSGRKLELWGLEQLKSCAPEKTSLRYRLSPAVPPAAARRFEEPVAVH